jgi:hypothetical protein
VCQCRRQAGPRVRPMELALLVCRRFTTFSSCWQQPVVVLPLPVRKSSQRGATVRPPPVFRKSRQELAFSINQY